MRIDADRQTTKTTLKSKIVKDGWLTPYRWQKGWPAGHQTGTNLLLLNIYTYHFSLALVSYVRLRLTCQIS